MTISNSKMIVAASGAIIGWFAVIAQFILMIQHRVFDIPETIIRFFSFFAILVNIIVAVYFTLIYLRPVADKSKSWFNASSQTAITVYILVVGIIYNLMLRSLWASTGMQKIVENLLHFIIPGLYFFYWLVFVEKQGLKWKQAFVWLLYPLLYFIAILIRGAFSNTNYYPYPFVDVYNHGYEKVFIGCGFILLLVLILSFTLIGVSKFVTVKNNRT
ncbi:MAG: Pr6Pr family membrane protein [Ferruginibacter sp.]